MRKETVEVIATYNAYKKAFWVAVAIIALLGVVMWIASIRNSNQISTLDKRLEAELKSKVNSDSIKKVHDRINDSLAAVNTQLQWDNARLFIQLAELAQAQKQISSKYTSLYEQIKNNSDNDTFQFALLQRLIAEHSVTPVQRN